MLVYLQQPSWYKNVTLVTSISILLSKITTGKLHHLALNRRFLRVDYFHHLLLRTDGNTFTIYESSSFKNFWKFLGVAEIQKTTLHSIEEVGTELDLSSGVWLISDYDENEHAVSLQRVHDLIGEKHYLPSGENCETFVRFVLTGRGGSFQFYDMTFRHAFLLISIEILALLLNRRFLLVVLIYTPSLIFGILAQHHTSISLSNYVMIGVVVVLLQDFVLLMLLIWYRQYIQKRYKDKRIGFETMKVQKKKFYSGFAGMLLAGTVTPIVFGFLSDISKSFFSNLVGIPSFLILFMIFGLYYSFELRRKSDFIFVDSASRF